MKSTFLLALLAFWSTAAASVPRKPLVEELTSTTCTFCDLSDSLVDTYTASHAGKICVLKWYTNYGNYAGTNPFYNAFKGGIMRSTFYKIAGVPRVQANGVHKLNPYTERTLLGPGLDTLIFDKTSPYAVKVKQSIYDGSVHCTIEVTLVDEYIDTNIRLGIAISEREIHFQEQTSAVNATSIHYSVVRATLPVDAYPFVGGHPTLRLPETLTQGNTATFTYDIPLDQAWNPAEIQTTAFLQNIVTGEVMQSEMAASQADVADMDEPIKVSAYPNPTSGILHIAYELPQAMPAVVSIFSLRGEHIADIEAPNAGNTITTDLSYLPSGVYFYRLHYDDLFETRRFILSR